MMFGIMSLNKDHPQSIPPISLYMAAYTVASVPMLLVFLFGMRYFIQGITSGAIKV